MNNFVERRLAAHYSALLFQHQVCEQDVFGFECLDGWSDLIEGSLRLIRRYAKFGAADVKVTQVKEKFGQLRIYQRGGNECVDLAIAIAELVSGCICELCGKTGNVVSIEGVMVTRCEEHRRRHLEQLGPPGLNEYYVAEYVQTVDSIRTFFEASAQYWVQQPCLALGSRRPYEMMGTREGCQTIYTLLKRLEHGVGV